jgi:UDP-glucose 4-epimerase
MKIAILGAGGSIGRELCSFLAKKNYSVNPIVRKPSRISNEIIIKSHEDLKNSLSGVNFIIYLKKNSRTKKFILDYLPWTKRILSFDYDLENVLKITKNNEIKNFIYISTIKVHGEFNISNQKFKITDLPCPKTFYSKDKLREEGLIHSYLNNESNINFLIIRPPLVYGKNVKGFFRLLKYLIKFNVPIPLQFMKTERSLVSINNLCRYIEIAFFKMENLKMIKKIILIRDVEEFTILKLAMVIATTEKKQLNLLKLNDQIYNLIINLTPKLILQKITKPLLIDLDDTVKLMDIESIH